MNALVSLIIPTFNRAALIEETLQSVVSQTYLNWECIVVDDGSLDNTRQIIKKWTNRDNRFQYILCENKGVSNARNIGIQTSKGEFIQFLDSDDILETNKLKFQISILNNNTNIDIVYGSSRYFFDGDFENFYPIHYLGINPMFELNKNDKNQKEVLIKKNICTNCAPIYRRKIFDVISFRNLVYEDWFFNLECSLNDFIFHYVNFESTNCLIRMTANSQMNNHGLDKERQKEFYDSFNNLIENKKFSSKLKKAKSDFLNKNKKPFLNKVLYNLTPPVLNKISNYLIQKIKL